MKIIISVFLFLVVGISLSQSNLFPENLRKTEISKLQNGDSLIYYQCRVDSASQELITLAGQKIKTKKKKITITEKFIIYKIDTTYQCNYFTSSITNYPNKKFPYLTLKEVENWEFEKKLVKKLPFNDVLLIATLETKTHAITHYQLNINKTCPNQLIIKSKKDVEQFIIEGNYNLSKSLNMF